MLGQDLDQDHVYSSWITFLRFGRKKNNQKINSNEANEFLISFNKISNYIDKDLILTFDFIFRESIKSNSNILFVKK